MPHADASIATASVDAKIMCVFFILITPKITGFVVYSTLPNIYHYDRNYLAKLWQGIVKYLRC